jgi:glycosyltransferase involved in cell wall biosynthesis
MVMLKSSVLRKQEWRMNILIPTFSFPAQKLGVYDGKFVFSEAVAYAKAGARVRVVTPHFPGSASIERVHKNIVVYRFPYFYPASLQKLRVPGVPIYRVKSFLAFCQIPLLCMCFSLAILRHAIWADIIHAQWTLSALLALPAKWIFMKKIVVTARGTDLRKFPKWLNQFVHRKVDAAVDCFGPQPLNESYKRTFAGNFLTLPLLVHADPCKQMPNDMKESIREEKGSFIILYVGRFDDFKIERNRLPIFDLVNAARILKDSGLNFHLLYVGGGNKRIEKRLDRLVQKFRLTDRIHLLGEKVNPTDYMQFADLGVGGVAFNAVSQEFTLLAKPQVLIALPDNINSPWHPGKNAVFVEPDSLEDLSEKLVWAIGHRDELKQIGENAKTSMRRYMLDSSTGGPIYLSAFKKLLNRHHCSCRTSISYMSN